MKVLVFPRSSNPYQADLYDAMAAQRQIDVRFLDGPTPSQTVNVLLLPFRLAVARAGGFRVLHVHWMYPFGLAWARRSVARRAVQWWYSLFLRTAAGLGFRLVWTAHNLEPHERVFHDDHAARRALVRRSDAVIVHGEATAAAVRSWGARRVAVVPAGLASGVYAELPSRRDACAQLGLDPSVARALFFGQVREYKGVDLLLGAVDELPPELSLHVMIVGECADGALRARLEARAEATPVAQRLHMRLGFASHDALLASIAAADFAVFPFRAVTNSSSVGYALAAGLPMVIPALATLSDVPDEAVWRYDPAGGSVALARAITQAASSAAVERSVMSAAAIRFAAGRTWGAAAATTWALFDDLVGVTGSGSAGRARHAPAAGAEVAR